MFSMAKKHKNRIKKRIKKFFIGIYNAAISLINGLRFLKNVIKNIKWPSKKEVVLYSIAVALISVIITAYLVSLDTIFNDIRLIILFK